MSQKIFYTLATLLPLPTLIQADFAFIQAQMRKKLASSSTSPLRNIQSVTYGCHCFYDEMPIMTGKTKPFKPKGKPVDKLDGYCKILNDAYECIELDGVEGEINGVVTDAQALDKDGNICNPRTASSNLSETWWIDLGYNMYNGHLSENQLKNRCLTLNNNIDSCEVYVCMIEAKFLMRFWDKNEDFLNEEDFKKYGHAWDTYGENVDYEGNFYDYESIHSFDPASSCSSDALGGGNEKSCCGNFPDRAVYRPRNGAVGCCNGKTYSTTFHSCCKYVDGSEKIAQFNCYN